MTQIEAEVDAAFAIELASSAALRAMVEKYWREAVYTAWRLGWCGGVSAGLQKAQRILGANSE